MSKFRQKFGSKGPLIQKVAFTAISIPMLYNSWWAYGWQLERKEWKKQLIEERTKKLMKPAKDVTIDQIPLDKVTTAEFDENWIHCPLRIRGVFDHDQETLVTRNRDNQRGYEIITPLYTSVDKDTGKLQGMFVNRGRLPLEYQDSGMHLTPPGEEQIVEGVLMYSEGEDPLLKQQNQDVKDQNALDKLTKAKSSESLTAAGKGDIRIDLGKFIDKTDLANRDFASKVYLKAVALTLDGKIEQAKVPRPAIPSDLLYWYVTPDKHQAYATFWFYLSGLNVAANIFIWFYL